MATRVPKRSIAPFQQRFPTSPDFKGFSIDDPNLALPGTRDENEAPSGLFREDIPLNPGNAEKPSGFQRAQAGNVESPPGFEPMPTRERLIAEPSPPGFEEIDEFSDVASTPGFEPETPVEPDIGQKMVRRFLGTDVQDPLELTRLGLTVVGTLGGGLAAGKFTPGPPIVKGIAAGAGATLGMLAAQVAPEMTMEAGEALGVLDPGTRERTGLSPEQLNTVVEGELLLDMATAGGFSILRTGGRLGARLLTGAGREGRELAEAGARQGIEMMPVQVGDRKIGRMFVSVMGRFPWIGSSIVKRGEASEQALKEALRGVPINIAPLRATTDISDMIFRDATATTTRIHDMMSAKYNALWARADELGVAITPRSVLAKGDEILRKIQAETPAFIDDATEATAGPALEKVRSFIRNDILPMRGPMEGVPGVRSQTRRQTFRQMDGLVTKIDQEIAALEPGQRRWALELMNQLRQAAQFDSITNVRGQNAKIIADEMKALDTEFSHTMHQLFETATAKRFGTVQRRGLRGVTTDEATRTNIDQLARSVVKLDSPDAMEELHRLVTPETYRAMSAQVVNDALADSMKAGANNTVQFVPDLFAKRLGLETFGEIPIAGRRQAIETMLEKAGSPIKITHLDELNRVAQKMSSLDIPNVSSFIARRAGIGGLRAIINAAIPGLVIAGGASYAVGPALGFAIMVGGGKLISGMISNPRSARALARVFDKEASQVVKRQATIDALRFGVAGLQEAGEIDFNVSSQMNFLINQTIMLYDKQLELVR